MTDLSGQYLGRYYLSERLGEGGMAVVYKAFDTRLERDIAIKIIRSGAFPIDAMGEVLKRFEREAKSLAKLSHPNIVKVHDYGEHEGSPYLVMEYLPGGTLKNILGSLVPWQEAVRLILPVARGVAYAHQRGILHRDIKPANILITESGEPMLSDFGIAKLFEGNQTTALTGSGMAIGTPEYMAPEQWTGVTSPQSDLYSLGIVLYELVAGRKPYVADTPAGILIKQATEPLPSPRKFAVDLPEALEHVLIKVLAREPEDRYKDVNAFISALESLHVGSQEVPPASRKGVEELYNAPTQKPVTPVPTQILTRDSSAKVDNIDVAESQKVEESPSFSDSTTRMPFSIKFSRKRIGLLIGGISIVLAVWLGSPLIGKWFASAPVSTEQAIATFTLASQPIVTSQTFEPIPASQTKILTFTPTSVIIETPLSVTPTLALGTTQISPIDSMVLHYVPAGTFTMGDTAEHASAECQKTGPSPNGCKLDRFTDEEPVHHVYLDAFWMDETEVTNAQYKLCVKAGACQKPSTISPYYSDDRHGDYPVVFVAWSDANSYCQWAERRLPTEAEWEKAARGIDGRTYPWGEAIGIEYANYNTSPGDVTRVGSYKLGKSPYGLYDMAGNVYEFVADWYHPDYYKTLGEITENPRGPSNGQSHVAKGGGFLYNSIRPAERDARDGATNENGFRCALSVDTTASQLTVTQTPTSKSVTDASPTQITDDKGVEMVLVPAGEFTIGANNYDNEKPVHHFYLNDFYMDIYEVTNELYKACVTVGTCTEPGVTIRYNDLTYASHPVMYVDWNQAKAYCEWRGGRLPTEAEWEKAARGMDARTYPWGEGLDAAFANYGTNVGDTTEVGVYEMGKSPYGVYDMAGNVQEWVSSLFMNYPYNAGDGREDLTAPGMRIFRGGAWNESALLTRSASRVGYYPYVKNSGIGFRCARDVTP